MQPRPVHVARMALTDFRSYAAAVVTAAPGLVVVTGDNGAGKTNLLEAISLLSPGRGLRGVALSDMARSAGPGGFAIAATLAVGDDPAIDIGTGTRATAPDRRLLRINGASAAASSLAEWLSVLWLTPAMDRLFTEAASGRRRFLDRFALALHPGHGHHAARYEVAMRARNRLLSSDGAPDPAWLSALERQMADHGAALAAARDDTVAALSAALAAAPDGPFPKATLALDGWTGESGDIADMLRARRRIDASAGRTTTGPHRVDLAVTHQAKGQPAARCSTGEQKALLLGLVLAHAALVTDKTGRQPLLLLDEVAAHLDAQRRGALFQQLAALGAQVWMTGTDRALFDVPHGPVTYIDVAGGQLRIA